VQKFYIPFSATKNAKEYLFAGSQAKDFASQRLISFGFRTWLALTARKMTGPARSAITTYHVRADKHE